jgi:hypothetical protein
VERALDRELLLAHRKQIGEGGFALAIGEPGTDKSAALRILAEHLSDLREVAITIPSAGAGQPVNIKYL